MSSNELNHLNPQKSDKSVLSEKDEEEETENEKENGAEEQKDLNNNLPTLQPLYPQVRDISFFDENITNNKILRLKKEEPKLRKENLTLEELEKKKLELNDKFLEDLIKDPCPLPKNNIIESVSLFIRNSTLINKLESSYKWKNEEELTSLCNLISKNLNYEKYNKGDILFKIGEIGNKFFFILKGFISILKLKEIPKVKMSYNNYFNLCIKLLKNKEYHILEETLKKNSNIIPIKDIEQLKKLYIIIFKQKLHQNILNNFIYNNNTLTAFFSTNEERLEEYDISLRELQPFEDLKKNKDWKAYLVKRIKPTKDELIYYEKYKEYIIRTIEMINITYYVYDDFLYLGAGFYFGESALEKGNIYTGGKRNATIRAETELICGSMKGGDYLNIIEPKKRMEKMQEIKFIFSNFFFKEISVFLFEKNYFHLFSACEYKKDEVIVNTGFPLKDLIFIREGEICMDMNSSIINIHNLIKYLYEYIFNNELFNKLPQNKQNKLINNKTISIINEYINEPIFKKLKGYSIKFNEELNKKRNLKIATLGSNDILGLEEIYLKIASITKLTVVSKKLIGYQISDEHLEQILYSEKSIITTYLKASINKIVTLIQRLQNIKQHYIKYFIQKYEKNVDNVDVEERKDLINSNYNSNNNGHINGLNKQPSEISFNKSKENDYINNNNKNEYNNLESKNNNSIIHKSPSKSPLKIVFQLNNKNPNKKLLIKFKKNHTTNKNSSNINIKILDNNKIRPRNNFDYNNGIDLKNLKNKKISKTLQKIKFFSFDKKNKRSIILGDKNISIKKLKNDFNEIPLLSQENSDLIQIIQSTKYNNLNKEINSPSHKKKDESKKAPILKGSSNYLKYHLSYVPLFNIKKRNTKTNPNIFNTESITSNFTPFQITIFSSNSNNQNTNTNTNNQSESRNNNNGNNTNNDSSSYINIQNQLTSKEIKKDKSQPIKNNFFDSYNISSRHIPKIFNLKSQEKIKGHINDKIKNFYKELKSKGCLSFIPNMENNTLFTRKFNQKYKSASKSFNKYFTSNSSQTEMDKQKKFLPIIKSLIK